MHDSGDRCLSDDANLVHHRNGYNSNELLGPLFKSADTNANNNDTSPRPNTDIRGKGASPENLPNENCSTICGGIVPVSSLETAIGHHPQLSTSTSVLTTANTSNLDDMNNTAAFDSQRYWTLPSTNNYNHLIFQTEWLSNQYQQQHSLLQHPQLQSQQVNESLMTSQMNGCASGNPQFMPTFYGFPTTDTSHNPMLFIQPPIQPVTLKHVPPQYQNLGCKVGERTARNYSALKHSDFFNFSILVLQPAASTASSGRAAVGIIVFKKRRPSLVGRCVSSSWTSNDCRRRGNLLRGP